MIQPLAFFLRYAWFWCGALIAVGGFFERRWRCLRNVLTAQALPCFALAAISLGAGYPAPDCAPPMFSFADAPSIATTAVMLAWGCGWLLWVWRGSAAELLAKAGYGSLTLNVRLVLTGFLLSNLLVALVSRFTPHVAPALPEYCR